MSEPWIGLLHSVDAVLAMHRQDERVTLSRSLVLELRACAAALAVSSRAAGAREP